MLTAPEILEGVRAMVGQNATAPMTGQGFRAMIADAVGTDLGVRLAGMKLGDFLAVLTIPDVLDIGTAIKSDEPMASCAFCGGRFAVEAPATVARVRTASVAHMKVCPDHPVSHLLKACTFVVNDAKPGEDAQLTVDGYNRLCAAIAYTDSKLKE